MSREKRIEINTKKIREAAPEFTGCCGVVRELMAALPQLKEAVRETRAAKRAAAERLVATMADVVSGGSPALPTYSAAKKAAEAAAAANDAAEHEFEVVMAELARESERLEALRVPAFAAIGGEGRRQHVLIVARMAELLIELAELEELEDHIYDAVDVTQLLPTNPLSSRPSAYLTKMSIKRLGPIDDENSSVGCWFRRAAEEKYDVDDILNRWRKQDAKRQTQKRSD